METYERADRRACKGVNLSNTFRNDAFVHADISDSTWTKVTFGRYARHKRNKSWFRVTESIQGPLALALPLVRYVGLKPFVRGRRSDGVYNPIWPSLSLSSSVDRLRSN